MKGKIIVLVLAGVAIIAASEYAFPVAGALINFRDSIAISSSILAGPVVGIIVGLIGGFYRMSMGGWSALPCGLATILASFIGAYLWRYKGYRIKNITSKQILTAIIITGIWEFIHLEIMVPVLGAKPMMEAFTIMTNSFLLPMAMMNMLGTLIILLLGARAYSHSQKRL